MLYTKDGSYPAPLPEGDFGVNEDGQPWWFQPLAGNEAAIASAGWVAVPEQPVVDPEVEKVTWNGDWWVITALTDEEKAERVRARVPLSVTPRQLRLALNGAGLLAPINAFVASSHIPDAARISWEYATEYLRTDPMLNQMAGMLDPPLSEADIDRLFIAAGGIQ